jgi:hypothetical protein
MSNCVGSSGSGLRASSVAQQPVLRRVHSTEALLYHTGVRSLLRRARGPATVRERNKQHQVCSWRCHWAGYGLPVTTGPAS